MATLLTHLHRFPNEAILVIVVGLVAGLAMAGPHIGRRAFRVPPSEEREEAALDAFKALMAMTGVVLAFALVEANNNLHTIEGLVAKEAVSISTADRALLRSGNPQLIAQRPKLTAYGRSIIADEWPSVEEDGERSEATDMAYDELSKSVRAVMPADMRQQAMFAELLKALDDMADWREQRLSESEAELPSFFWVTAFGLLATGWLLALLAADTLATTVALGATSAAVALVLSFVVIVDQPFEGETSVKPKEIAKALMLNDRRQ